MNHSLTQPNHLHCATQVLCLPETCKMSYDSLCPPVITQFTQSAIPVNPAAQYADYGFIAVLGLAQRLCIDFLPVTWQAALGSIGEGGEGRINQSLINLQTSFAFKLFIEKPETACPPFQNFVREIVMLSQPSI